jgi:adenylate cyclase
MFTDTVGYTASTQRDESRTLALLEEQQQIVRPVVVSHRGHEIKSTGDGFLVEFGSALDATRCAVDIQRKLHDRGNGTDGVPIRIRIGIHLGDVVQRGQDILGDAVNIAARVEPAAESGGVCVTSAVRDQVWNKIPERLEKLGPTALKGVQSPVDIYRIVLSWTNRGPAAMGETGSGIAVLPFANISPDPQDEYFADGLTEELITVMSQLKGLRVIARTSVTPYKSTTKGVAQIGAELGVSSILEGSVRKAGSRLRITAQLIDVGTQGHLWSDTYDRELNDVFALQSDMAKQVADALKVKLLAREEEILERRPPARPESYLEYLQGRNCLHGFSEAEMREGQEHFERAIELDETNAAAHAGLAEVHRLRGNMYYHLPRSEWDALSRIHAARALELDPNLAEAHVALADILDTDGDFAASEKELRRALALNPSYSWAHLAYSELLQDQMRTEEALRELSIAEQLDPLSALVLHQHAIMLTRLRRLDEAEQVAVRLERVENNGLLSVDVRFSIHMLRGQYDRCLEDIQRIEELVPGRPEVVAASAMYHAVRGDHDRARELLRSVESLPEPVRPDVQIATVYARLGDLDATFHWLDIALDARRIGIRMWRQDPDLAAVREDPRFQKLLERMHLG